MNPAPAGYHSLQPYLIVRDAAKAIDFYRELFGATEVTRLSYPGGAKLMHAEVRIGDSILMLSDEAPEWSIYSPIKYGGSSVSLMLYVAEVDELYAKALASGCQTIFPPADMFWGDRFCKFIDPFGHVWGVATHVRDVTAEEMAAAAAAKEFPYS